ncbi:MAG: hypothetical protein KKH98_12910 [Spirochaetes bacterium]|nr:hypothetical protein [Spirochaetota bacterium]
MILHKKEYNINELCELVIKEIHNHLNSKCIYDNLTLKEKNHIICEWINQYYNRLYSSYLKEHPIK